MEVGNVTLGACMPPERQRIKTNEERRDLLAAKPERRSTTGGPLGQVQSSNKKGGQTETAGGLGSQRGVDNMIP